MIYESPVFRKPNFFEQILNKSFGILVGLGVGLRHNYLLQVRGRKTGRVYSTPIDLLEFKERWRETPYYTERERAALAWTEALTLIADNHVPDEVYDQTRKQFSEQELADLTLAIVAINGWNRIAISFRQEPGTYQPASRKNPRSSRTRGS